MCPRCAPSSSLEIVFFATPVMRTAAQMLLPSIRQSMTCT